MNVAEEMSQCRTLSWQNPVTGSVYGVLFNFRDQYKAMENMFNRKPYEGPPKRPVMYVKPKNTMNYSGSTIILPKSEKYVQICGTLGVVISRTAVNVHQEEALDYIEGYTIINDVTIPHDTFFRPNIKNKVRDGFCSVGPRIVNKSLIDNLDEVTIHTYINNELRLTSNMKGLVRPIEKLIEDVTEFMTLFKGDILLAGIPANAPVAQAGDVVSLSVDQIGILENPIEGDSK